MVSLRLPVEHLRVMIMEIDERLLRRVEVENLIGLSRSAIYLRMQSGQFPQPVRVGKNAVRWRESAVRSWIAARPPARETE